MSVHDNLWRAYETTTFTANLDGTVVPIRPGARHPELDRLLSSRHVDSWAFITAWNPRSQLLSSSENDGRHEQLKRDVAELGLHAVEGHGIPADSNWLPERGLIVLGIAERDAVALGRRYGQSA